MAHNQIKQYAWNHSLVKSRGPRNRRAMTAVQWALATLLMAAGWRAHDAFLIPSTLMPVRRASSASVLRPLLSLAPRQPLSLRCSPDDARDDAAGEEEHNEAGHPEGGAEEKDEALVSLSETDAAMVARINEAANGKGEARTRRQRTFQLAWKQKFKGKGVQFNTPTKEEVEAKLGHEIETEQGQLRDLRARASMLASRLEAAVSEERYSEAAQMRDELQLLRLRDPLHLREHLWSQMERAGESGDFSRAAALRVQVQEVQSLLPQYQLGGEWEGIYASHGKETVLVRYEGSTLVAVKLTGDENVPKGEITFTADLSPDGLLGPVGADEVNHPAEKIRMVLEGHLENIVAIKGQGQVAKPGFKSPQFVEGQMLVFEEGIIGFIFLPLAAMIIFEKHTDPAEEQKNIGERAGSSPSLDPEQMRKDPQEGDSTPRDRDLF